MSPARRTYFIVCAALVGDALGYALPVYARLPRAFYDPAAHRWTFDANLGPIPLGYLGQVLWGAGAALALGLVAWVVTGRLAREPTPEAAARAEGLWGAWALSALAIVAAYFTWNNWP